MKIDLSKIPSKKLQPEVMVGNVYPAKGGRGGTVAWLVVSVTEKMAHVLGLNVEGEIVSTFSYGIHAFESRDIIGHCPDVRMMTLGVTA